MIVARARRGSTLMETLVAFAVMSTVLAVALPGQARLFGRVVDRSERVLAQDLVLSVLDEAGLSTSLPRGSDVEERHGWRIVRTSEPMPGLEGIVSLRVEVLAEDGTRLADGAALKRAP